jgi:hypothetical protein
MPVAQLNLGLGSNKGQDGQVSNIRHINCYVEDAGEDAKNQAVLYACPGLTRWDDGEFSGASRGLIQLSTNELIAFLGNEIVSLDQNGASTKLANIVGSGRLHLARNRAGTPEIGIITSAGQYYILAGGTLTQVTDGDLPSPNSIAYLKGFFVYSISDGRLFMSDLEDGTSIGALAFDTANTRSEGIVKVFPHAGFLYVFGRRATEIWQADPSLASEPFVFSPIQQDIDIGCIAPHSVAQAGNGLAWVDDDGIVRLGRDGGAQRISNHAVERAIEGLTNTEREAIAGRQWFHQGHEFYTLFSDDFTWTFDLLTQRWHERMSYGSLIWRVNDIVAFDGKYITSDKDSGALYRMNSSAYDEDGDILLMEAQGPISHRSPGAMLVNNVEADVISGVGVAQSASGIYFRDGSHVSFGDVLDRTGTFTLEAIFNAHDIAAVGQRIITKDNSSAGWAISLGDGSPGSLRFFHRSMNTIITDSPSGTISANVNCHVAVVFDATADTVTMYIDGVQVAQTTGQTNAIVGNSNSLAVGAGPDDPSGNKNFKGFIRDIRIWDVARSQAQIIANMKATLTGSESGLVGYWKFDEQTGATANDSSASNFDGSLVGNAVWSSTYWQHNANPQLMFSYSRDGGRTFTGERRASIGKMGKYRQKIRFNRLGRIDEKGRIFKLAASAAVLRGFISAHIDARPVR